MIVCCCGGTVLVNSKGERTGKVCPRDCHNHGGRRGHHGGAPR